MSARDRLDAIRARAEAATEGPWRWRNTGNVYLSGARTRVVMAFSRMGMQGAQPLFRDADNVLQDVGRANINAYPDAEFIAASRSDVPDLVAFARAVLDLHVPDDHGPGRCDDPDCETECQECYHDWPCATVRLATEHLTNGDDDE